MKKSLTLIVFLLIVFLLVKGWWDSQLSPVSNDKSTKIVVIEKGESFSKLAEELKKQNLIKSSWAFNLYAKQMRFHTRIQAGTFRLAPSMSSEQVLKILSSQPSDNWVTLLEGWRVEEMAEKLNLELGIKNSEFFKVAKEGYMFPDTYLFPKDYTVFQIAKKLRDNFEAKYSENLRAKIRSLGLTEGHGVILASIVEREARSGEARRMVASILLRRFKIGMALNADATVQYALGYQKEENSWWKRSLSRDDLKVNSVYNTYLHAGFPPTPISNPSLSSLEAVANADLKTSYLYYYHDSKGNSHYAKTLEEHNQNIANYP